MVNDCAPVQFPPANMRGTVQSTVSVPPDFRGNLIPTAQSKFTIAPLLQVPPASRGEPSGARVRFPLLAGGTCRRGFGTHPPTNARGTERGAGSVPPACRGNLQEGVRNSSPRFARGTVHRRAGETCRRGFNGSHAVLCALGTGERYAPQRRRGACRGRWWGYGA